MATIAHRAEAGFSLVEVIVAFGLLAGVLLSIAGLFTLGGRQLASGRNTTEALSVAQAIVEEIQGWGFHQTWSLFGIDGENVSAATVDTKTNSYASKWQPTLEQKLLNGYAEIEIRALGSGGAPVLAQARFIRVQVTVHWDEGSRHRQIHLATVRM